MLLVEVPYLGTLIRGLEFDTIYHEHLSYLSIHPLARLCGQYGFEVTDAEPVPLHGGSLLFSIQRAGTRRTNPRVARLVQREQRAALSLPGTLQAFSRRVVRWKSAFESCIERLHRSGARMVGYGAAAKANTLLNFCPSAAARLACVLDRSPHKQGLFTPGAHVPVVSPDGWEPNGATHMLITAWNFKDEIMRQMSWFAGQGGRFVIPIPRPRIVSGQARARITNHQIPITK